MKTIVIISLIFLQSLFNFDAITDENILKKNAENSYYLNKYDKTISYLEKLSDDKNEDKYFMYLNIAHSFFNLKNYNKAYKIYKKSIKSTNKNVQSIALMQIGLIHAISAKEMQNDAMLQNKANEQYLKSLNYIKKSILANPDNELARLNYEILANNNSLKNLKLESIIHKSTSKIDKPETNKAKKNINQQTKEEENSKAENTLGKSEIKSENETDKKGLAPKSNTIESGNTNNKNTNNIDSENGMSAKNVSDNGNLQGGIEKNRGLASDKGKQNGKIELDKQTEGEEKPQMNKDKLKSMRISKEAALKLLDEMQQNEKQFLQHYYLHPDVKGKPNYKQKW